MMHIPPYYKKPKWQAFFVGIIVGTMVGYLFFLYIYGEHTERWIEENLTLRKELRNLEQDYELLKKDTDDLSKQSEQLLRIKDVEIELLNIDQLKLDRFTTLRLTALIEDEIGAVVGNNISSVSEQRDLLVRTIENKTFKVNQIQYQVKVIYLTIGPTLDVSLEISIQSS
ncbi:sporulation membrane protein YtrI [Piscibacillus salipiscarius]|uniref:Sporulation membrane protein YtrI n=1 Tax=Piscibacillus salipiscarius TaxID=299480 RepID=A0ABW5QDK6_9BACI|nr:sporulation membrane protein YtrI [Piscibacillus salipiscarius]